MAALTQIPCKYRISQKAWKLCWKMIFTQAFTSHSYGVLGNLVD
jgi:hypothetical protein